MTCWKCQRPATGSIMASNLKIRYIDPLKTEFLLNNIYKSSLYLTGNT
jgi:hypothetical protein